MKLPLWSFWLNSNSVISVPHLELETLICKSAYVLFLLNRFNYGSRSSPSKTENVLSHSVYNTYNSPFIVSAAYGGSSAFS